MDSKLWAVVTGANSGVGLETSRVLAEAGWGVVMVCRSEQRGRAARDSILEEVPGARLEVAMCDLERFDQVHGLAEWLLDWSDGSDRRIGVLINNAGLYRAGLERTGAGFERTMAVNHLGHFLLTLLLESQLRREGPKVVNVTSEGHRRGQLGRAPLRQILLGEDWVGGVQAYCDSKLANVLFTQELQRRWGSDGAAVAAVHPGVLSTAIWDRNRNFLMWLARLMKPFMGSPEEGGRAVARLVLDVEPSELRGAYFKRRERDRAQLPEDADELARTLWSESLSAVGLD